MLARRGRSFFFQAGDGIRSRSPSRGLGDVYKGQGEELLKRSRRHWLEASTKERQRGTEKRTFSPKELVPNTHLTLPTINSV